MITGDGTIKLGRDVGFNSSFKSNVIGGFRSVLSTRTKDASIEIDDAAGLSNVVIVAFTHIYIGKNVNIGAERRFLIAIFTLSTFWSVAINPK